MSRHKTVLAAQAPPKPTIFSEDTVTGFSDLGDRRFSETAPGIRIEVIVGNKPLNPARGDEDIRIFPSPKYRPSPPDLKHRIDCTDDYYRNERLPDCRD
ncbi:hypothetical protein [Pseudomonas gingeri]|uniref:hypothetical protein n=1 Tax=Pseudomonas gingeri TaxID=117681 RepID=UPI0015A23786|nr:hypothetical protein [Pseudomonas gingeri]NWA00772.1 hypothetical protein [Pseudomonas gingeri]NWA16184.1 hypothetical protein [Pseudomonas gingeri]NWA54374.1 hypothetical protein [Pseudomonas gingeri]NWA97549.1 hypothetical protein [Pseudomonas gingeri]NWB04355.1 hypothetical protein [Pseudomonas gingeri]